MMMKSVFWWRKPEYPEETTDLRQVTDETFQTYGLCPVRGLNLGRSGVKQSELRRDESSIQNYIQMISRPVCLSVCLSVCLFMIRYISQDNIHEINTWKCPIQTQCG